MSENKCCFVRSFIGTHKVKTRKIGIIPQTPLVTIKMSHYIHKHNIMTQQQDTDYPHSSEETPSIVMGLLDDTLMDPNTINAVKNRKNTKNNNMMFCLWSPRTSLLLKIIQLETQQHHVMVSTLLLLHP
jgi:hypothetical protein